MSSRLWQETLALGEDYISLCCSSRWLAPLPPSQSAAAMRHLAGDMERQHQADLRELAQRLRQHEPDPCTILRRVMAEMSVDGDLNWGRVVSIFSLAGVVAKQLRAQRLHQVQQRDEAEEEQARINRRLAVTIADYLADEKRDWLLEHNGWNGFVEFSRHAASTEHSSSLKRFLYAAAGVGLAGLTFLTAGQVSTSVLRVLLQAILGVEASRNP